MRLSIHIGMGKTGTTALQSFMKNHDGLIDQGILYAGVRLGNLPPSLGKVRHKVPSGTGVADTRLALKNALADLERAAVQVKGVNHVIWSNEALVGIRSNRDVLIDTISEFLTSTKVFDETEIILVLRRQDEWIESAYRQWGLRDKTYRGHKILAPGEFLDRIGEKLDYLELYRSWARVGAERIRVISYDDIRETGGVVRHFCEYFGIPWDDAFSRYDAVNPSFGPAQSYFIATYNAGFRQRSRGNRFASVIRHYDLPELSSPDAAFFPTRIRKEILDRYDPGNGELARLALGRARLFSDRPVRECVPYATAQRDVLIYLAMLAKAQHEENMTLAREIKLLKKRINGSA